MNNKIKSTLSILIITLFVFLFTYTAVSKILHHSLFLITLHQSPLVSGQAEIISWLLPIVELLTVVLLIIKNTQRLGMYITLILMLIFSVYVLYLLLFIPDLPCSCGGILQSLSWNQHLILNLLLSFLALFEILLFNIPIYKNKILTG